MQNVNRVIVTGNLTRDPELKTTNSGLEICNLRIAVNSRVKQQDEWVDKPNYFDVAIFGGQARVSGQYLAKGRPVAIDGRLDWREWTTESGDKRQAVQIIADTVQFLGDGSRDDESGVASTQQAAPAQAAAAPAVPDEDDIPF